MNETERHDVLAQVIHRLERRRVELHARTASASNSWDWDLEYVEFHAKYNPSSAPQQSGGGE